jgi:hypothetical protein
MSPVYQLRRRDEYRASSTTLIDKGNRSTATNPSSLLLFHHKSSMTLPGIESWLLRLESGYNPLKLWHCRTSLDSKWINYGLEERNSIPSRLTEPSLHHMSISALVYFVSCLQWKGATNPYLMQMSRMLRSSRSCIDRWQIFLQP